MNDDVEEIFKDPEELDEKSEAYILSKYIRERNDDKELHLGKLYSKRLSGKKIAYIQKYKKMKRTEVERERDLVDIARLYLQGYTQGEIGQAISAARSYSLSRPQISVDIKTIWERWRESQIRDFDLLRMKECAKLDVMEAELWEAWERSKEDYEEQYAEKVSDTMGKDSDLEDSAGTIYTRNKVKRITKHRDAAEKYMSLILKIVEKRSKLLGLDAPTKSQIDINWREKALEDGLDPDLLLDDLTQEFMKHAKKRSETARSAGMDESGDSGGAGESEEDSSAEEES